MHIPFSELVQFSETPTPEGVSLIREETLTSAGLGRVTLLLCVFQLQELAAQTLPVFGGAAGRHGAASSQLRPVIKPRPDDLV